MLMEKVRRIIDLPRRNGASSGTSADVGEGPRQLRKNLI